MVSTYGDIWAIVPGGTHDYDKSNVETVVRSVRQTSFRRRV